MKSRSPSGATCLAATTAKRCVGSSCSSPVFHLTHLRRQAGPERPRIPYVCSATSRNADLRMCECTPLLLSQTHTHPDRFSGSCSLDRQQMSVTFKSRRLCLRRALRLPTPSPEVCSQLGAGGAALRPPLCVGLQMKKSGRRHSFQESAELFLLLKLRLQLGGRD